MNRKLISGLLLITFAFLASAALSVYFLTSGIEQSVRFLMIGFSTFIILQGIITLIWMLYSWNDPEKADNRKSPKIHSSPFYSFTALVPMRNESKVVFDTIKAVDVIDYPDSLKEIAIIVRSDDKHTIDEVQKTIAELKRENITLHVLWETFPINKPLSLNMGYKNTKKQVVVVFDAEDEPSPYIYKIINSVLMQGNYDVVQSGVQLMDYNSRWFSIFNVLEYFLWFKSGMHFFADIGGVSVLGGNTVFIKREYLDKIGGWDEKMLTEDADIGIRLTLAGAKSKVIYDEEHVTAEETPPTVADFIKQRTRWDHGFLQILCKGDWLLLPNLKQRLASLYALIAPFFPLFMLLYLPLAIFLNYKFPAGVFLAIYTYIPFYILVLIVATQIVAMWEFTRVYNQKFKLMLIVKIIIFYVPYVLLLFFSALRSIVHFAFDNNHWEKTTHINNHRKK